MIKATNRAPCNVIDPTAIFHPLKSAALQPGISTAEDGDGAHLAAAVTMGRGFLGQAIPPSGC